MTSLRNSYKLLLLTLSLAALLGYAWVHLTRTLGEQKVSFRAAQQYCDVSGPMRYCVNTDSAGTNGDVIYHLHGRNLDEQVWNDETYFTAMLQAEWKSIKVVPPTVITVSYGPTWILTPEGKQPKSGLLEDFIARLPGIESKLGKTPRRRILLGESMGGLNVLIAGLSYPQKFVKVAAVCPGVYTLSPFASLASIRAAMQRTGASPKVILGIVLLARKYTANDNEWQRISPLHLVEQANPSYPALYLSCGLYDDYGNYEGTQRLAEIANLRGEQTEWHPLYGGHCAIDVRSLAEFLVS
jgi:S-formylglutathione hydrolase FrmB